MKKLSPWVMWRLLSMALAGIGIWLQFQKADPVGWMFIGAACLSGIISHARFFQRKKPSGAN